MAKVSTKPNKKEEQKKLAVRIVCLVLVVALAVTSLLAMFPYLFQRNDDGYSVEELLAAGVIYLGEDGNYYFTDEYLHAIEDTEHDHE
ncbi:MAG: hypothetical protein PUC00_07485 [Clostridiales bacterium]|nr:hypothetical protein [Clostridiales bacterium]